MQHACCCSAATQTCLELCAGARDCEDVHVWMRKVVIYKANLKKKTFQNSHFFLCLHPNFDFDFSIYFTVIQLHSISHLKFPYITRQTLCNVSERTRTIRRIPVTTNRYKPPPQESGVYVWVLLRPVAFLSHHQHFSSSLPGTVPPLSYFPAIHIHPLLYAVLYKCCVRCC